MNLILVVYFISKTLSFLSLGIATTAIATVFFPLLSRRFAINVSISREIFKAGTRVRNACLCFLVLVFAIANKDIIIKGQNSFIAMSNLCKVYALGSIIVFIATIIMQIIAAMKKQHDNDLKQFFNQALQSSLLSTIVGFLLSYLLYIP